MKVLCKKRHILLRVDDGRSCGVAESAGGNGNRIGTSGSGPLIMPWRFHVRLASAPCGHGGRNDRLLRETSSYSTTITTSLSLFHLVTFTFLPSLPSFILFRSSSALRFVASVPLLCARQSLRHEALSSALAPFEKFHTC
jgi:hypothetical protein